MDGRRGKSARESGNGQLLESVHHVNGTGLGSLDLLELRKLSSSTGLPGSQLTLCFLSQWLSELGEQTSKDLLKSSNSLRGGSA